jgi:D-glycero-alpha-D-manno-heptose-7-phosphate kinase
MQSVAEVVVRSRAPTRIDLAGGWTDVPPFAQREGGAVVSIAIGRYTYASLRRSGTGVRLRSDDYDAEVRAPDVAALRYDGTLDLLKAALRRMDIAGPLELITRADVPPGSGLGTSAATGIALVGAIAALGGDQPDRMALAALATSLEIDELGIKGGVQDQLAAALGGVLYMTFGAEGPGTTPLALSPGMEAELEKRLVLCYSGVGRVSGNIIERVQARYEAADPITSSALRELRAVAMRLRHALLDGAIDEVGPLLRANWDAQRALHPSITNPAVERLFAVAEQHGATGGKACGAGGGGCIAFLAPADGDRDLRRALSAAGGVIVDWSIDRGGLRTWRIDADGRIGEA